MKAGLVHFVASDAHGSRDRTPDMREAFGYISERYGPKCAEHLFVVNPRAVIRGRPLPKFSGQGWSPHRKWYQFRF
jgi:protein-tyrosine phosphatase